MSYRIVVPVSGGKDSQACLKLALQHYPANEVLGLFCDTKFEHPLTYEHVARMSLMYGVRIETVNNGSVEEQVLKHGRFPGSGSRFCTEELKIWPSKRFYRDLALQQGSRLGRKKRGKAFPAIEGSTAGGFEVWYGMRSDESTERKTRYEGKVNDELYTPNEVLKKYPKYLARLGVMFRLSVLDWSTAEVFAFLGGEHNPLYDLKDEEDKPLYDRVGCFPCQASGDKPKENAFHKGGEFGREQYRKVLWLGQQIGKSIWTSKGGKARNEGPGCALCAM